MATVTPKATGVVNIPGPITRHLTGQIFTIVGVAGTAGSPTIVDYSTATVWNSSTSTRDTVDIGSVAPAALQVFNLDLSNAIFISVDGEDPTAAEGSPISSLNGFQLDQPSKALSLAVWSAAGGEAFTVRAFLQAELV